jgi:hypothetical protein
MNKTMFMIIWVALLLGQVPLAGSVVICTTEDGRAHIERPDHHGHWDATHHDCDHDHAHSYADSCAEPVVPTACCRDITLNSISPSLVHAKRVAHEIDAMLLLDRVGYASEQTLDLTSMSHHRLDTGPDILRSVILLI